MASTRESILDAAQAIAQAEGYNALSFRELADREGIKSASVHYHFPTKGDLARALMRRYLEAAQATLVGLTTSRSGVSGRLNAYIKGFRQALERDNRMCLCGIFGAEYDHLSEEVRSELHAFVEVNVAWLAEVLSELQPKAQHSVHRHQALAIYTAIAGAQLTARTLGDITVYDKAIDAYAAAGLLPCKSFSL